MFLSDSSDPHVEMRFWLYFSLPYLIGYVLGWWRRGWGGIIIILSALMLYLFYILTGEGWLIMALIFGSPIFVVGVFYLSLYQIEKAQAFLNV
jgi:hypothetical protein